MKILFGLELLAGMMLVLLSPALGHVLTSLHVGEGAGGVLFFTYFLGGSLSTLSISWLPRFLSSRRILQVCSVLAGLCLLGFSRAGSLVTAVFFYFFVGASSAVLVAFPGALLTSQYRQESGRVMSILYASFAAGVTLCPLASGFLLERGLAWQCIFQGMAAVCLICAFLLSFFSLPSMEESEGLRWSSLVEAGKGDKGLLAGAVLLNILYIGGEASVGGWVVYYLQKAFAGDTSVFRASRVLTYFWLFMIAGRVATAYVVGRVGSLRTMVFLVCGGILTWVSAVLVTDLLAAEALFSLIGLFFSGMFPVIASFAGRFQVRHTGLVFSVILAGGSLGGAIFPFLVGWIAHHEGLQVGLASALTSLFLMLVVLTVLGWRGADV